MYIDDIMSFKENDGTFSLSFHSQMFQKYSNSWIYSDLDFKQLVKMIDFPVNHITSSIFDEPNGTYQNMPVPFPVDLQYNIC